MQAAQAGSCLLLRTVNFLIRQDGKDAAPAKGAVNKMRYLDVSQLPCTSLCGICTDQASSVVAKTAIGGLVYRAAWGRSAAELRSVQSTPAYEMRRAPISHLNHVLDLGDLGLKATAWA